MLVYRKREVERSYFARPEDMPRLLHALLLRRGVTSASEARAFLSPGEETLRDPLLLSDMGRAVSRLRAALLRELALPERLTANGLLEALNVMCSREEYEAALAAARQAVAQEQL